MIPNPPKQWYAKIPYYIIVYLYIFGNYIMCKWDERKSLDSIPKDK